MPINAPIRWSRYDDGYINIDLTPPQSISGMSLKFTLSHHHGSTSGLAFKYAASGYNNVSGINVIDGGAGRMRIDLFRSDLSGLDQQNLAYQLERTDSGFASILTQDYLSLI